MQISKDKLVIEKAETKDGSDLQSLPFCGILFKAMRRKGWCLLMLAGMYQKCICGIRAGMEEI